MMKAKWKPSARNLLLLPAATLCCALSFAQTSSELVKSDPTEQYQAVKATMQQFYDRGLLRSHIPFSGSGEYDLANCVEAGDFTGSFEGSNSRGKDISSPVNLAIRMVIWENDFRRLGVPDAVWKSFTSYYEVSSLPPFTPLTEKQELAFNDRLVAALNRYRQQSGKPLPKFVIEGGCGSGEIEVHIALSPPDGQLFLIPIFNFKLCEVQHLNPADIKSCDRWKEILNGSAAYVAGGYMYQARWADGSLRCGLLGFTNANVGGKTYSIAKIRSPECNLGW